MCESKVIPETVEKSIVGSDSSRSATMEERRQPITSSQSNESLYSVFDKAHGKGGALNNSRKYRQKVKNIPPPANNSKITDHFHSNSASRRSNEPGIKLVRKPGEKL